MFEKPDYKRSIRFFNAAQEPINVNQAGLDFDIDEDSSNQTILKLKVPKFLDTELIDVDCQPQYVRVMVKGRPFQIVLKDEVSFSSRFYLTPTDFRLQNKLLFFT